MPENSVKIGLEFEEGGSWNRLIQKIEEVNKDLHSSISAISSATAVHPRGGLPSRAVTPLFREAGGDIKEHLRHAPKLDTRESETAIKQLGVQFKELSNALSKINREIKEQERIIALTNERLAHAKNKSIREDEQSNYDKENLQLRQLHAQRKLHEKNRSIVEKSIHNEEAEILTKKLNYNVEKNIAKEKAEQFLKEQKVRVDALREGELVGSAAASQPESFFSFGRRKKEIKLARVLLKRGDEEEKDRILGKGGSTTRAFNEGLIASYMRAQSKTSLLDVAKTTVQAVITSALLASTIRDLALGASAVAHARSPVEALPAYLRTVLGVKAAYHFGKAGGIVGGGLSVLGDILGYGSLLYAGRGLLKGRVGRAVTRGILPTVGRIAAGAGAGAAAGAPGGPLGVGAGLAIGVGTAVLLDILKGGATSAVKTALPAASFAQQLFSTYGSIAGEFVQRQQFARAAFHKSHTRSLHFLNRGFFGDYETGLSIVQAEQDNEQFARIIGSGRFGKDTGGVDNFIQNILFTDKNEKERIKQEKKRKTSDAKVREDSLKAEPTFPREFPQFYAEAKPLLDDEHYKYLHRQDATRHRAMYLGDVKDFMDAAEEEFVKRRRYQDLAKQISAFSSRDYYYSNLKGIYPGIEKSIGGLRHISSTRHAQDRLSHHVLQAEREMRDVGYREDEIRLRVGDYLSTRTAGRAPFMAAHGRNFTEFGDSDRVAAALHKTVMRSQMTSSPFFNQSVQGLAQAWLAPRSDLGIAAKHIGLLSRGGFSDLTSYYLESTNPDNILTGLKSQQGIMSAILGTDLGAVSFMESLRGAGVSRATYMDVTQNDISTISKISRAELEEHQKRVRDTKVQQTSDQEKAEAQFANLSTTVKTINDLFLSFISHDHFGKLGLEVDKLTAYLLKLQPGLLSLLKLVGIRVSDLSVGGSSGSDSNTPSTNPAVSPDNPTGVQLFLPPPPAGP